MGGWMDGKDMDGWMDGSMDRSMDGRTDGWVGAKIDEPQAKCRRCNSRSKWNSWTYVAFSLGTEAGKWKMKPGSAKINGFVWKYSIQIPAWFSIMFPNKTCWVYPISNRPKWKFVFLHVCFRRITPGKPKLRPQAPQCALLVLEQSCEDNPVTLWLFKIWVWINTY